MTCGAIMTRNPISVREDETIGRAAKQILDHRYINLPVVDWVMNKATKKKELRNYSIDFGVRIFCGNCVEYCPTNCLSMTEEYELAAFDRHSLNYDNVALGRLPTSVTTDP